jgi:hypothetical protein
MRAVALVAGLICSGLAALSEAGEFKIGEIAIDVPARFEGPVTAQAGTRARTHAFTVRAPNPLLPSTVLQVTEYHAAEEAHAGSPTDVAQRFLSQMLEGIERRRTEYQKTVAKEVQLAGFAGSVASWQGKANGIGTNGTMFCIVTKSELLFFHVMGGGNTPNADMVAAIKAVENARKF